MENLFIIPFFTLLSAVVASPTSSWSADDLQSPVLTNIKNISIICTVSADKPLHKVPSGIFGTNLEWFNNGNGFLDQNLQPKTTLETLAARQGVSLIRFPGGTLSDFYDWKNGIGPVAERTIQPHGTDTGSSLNSFGSPELFRLCQHINAAPLITVNAGVTGTASMAADWVTYANAQKDPRRIQDGFEEPINIQYWEIGNELYLNGTDAEKEVTLTPEEYTAKFIDYAKAMRKVDPSIQLLALGVGDSYTIPFGPYKNWNQTLLNNKEALSNIDFLAFHNAYFPILIPDIEYPSAESVYKALWAAPLAVDQDLENIENLLKTYDKEKRINIAITEWGIFFGFNHPKWIDHVKTLGSAIYTARIMQVFLKHPRVQIANYFKFTDQTFMGWVGYDGTPKVPFSALEMFTQHFGNQLITTEIQNSPTYTTQQTGFVKAQQSVPELSAVASIGDNGNLYIIIVSCSWEKSHAIALNTPNYRASTQAKLHILNGSSPLANNGSDLPDSWPWDYTAPSYSGGPVTIKTVNWNTQTNVIIPPHSIVSIELFPAGDQ